MRFIMNKLFLLFFLFISCEISEKKAQNKNYADFLIIMYYFRYTSYNRNIASFDSRKKLLKGISVSDIATDEFTSYSYYTSMETNSFRIKNNSSLCGLYTVFYFLHLYDANPYNLIGKDSNYNMESNLKYIQCKGWIPDRAIPIPSNTEAVCTISLANEYYYVLTFYTGSNQKCNFTVLAE